MRLFPRKAKKSLSIDFGSSHVKIIEGEITNNEIEITNGTNIKIPQGLYTNGLISDVDRLANIIKREMKEQNIVFGETYGIINNSAIITREVTIPKVRDDEIDAVLKYQLKEYFPVNPDNYVVQYIPLGVVNVDDKDKLKILLIGVPRAMIKEHFNLMEKIGLRPEALDFQGNAILKLLNFNNTFNRNFDIEDKTIATLDIGMESVKINIIKNDILMLTRILDIGMINLLEILDSLFPYSRDYFETYVQEIKDINEKSDADSEYYKILNITRNIFDDIMEKCDMTFRYYNRKESENNIDYILLHGEMPNINGTEEMFSNYFNIPCYKMNYFDNINNFVYYQLYPFSTYANAIGGLIRIEEV